MRIERFLPIVVIAVCLFFGYSAMLCGVSPECELANFLNDYSFTIFKPLWVFSLFSIPAVLLLPVVKKRVFDAWLRFAIVWIILSVVVIGSTATSTNAWFSIIDFVREDAARIMGILFSGLSLFLLAWQTYMPKKVREAKL
jgi:hypothetical protein